ncbi:MAG: hypothetical protein AAF443_06945 [Chlamydiota bacterium]
MIRISQWAVPKKGEEVKFFRRKKKPSADQLEPLLWQLRELIGYLPTPIDLYEWREDIDAVMRQIRAFSLPIHERLEGLVLELGKRGVEHVHDLDDEESPAVTEESARRYFEQASFLTSEIQSLRPSAF